MRKIPLFISLLISMMSSFAQVADPVKYGSTITGERLKSDLSIIASDSMEGRETGTAGQRKAAAYIESRFRRSALKCRIA